MSDKIHIVGTLKAVLYPRPATKLGTPGNAFGIIKVINDVGETYTIKGSFTVPLDKGTEYEFVTTVYDDEKYGETYKLIYFQSNVDFTDIDNQKGFLRQILTKKQVDALYSEYDDVLQILEDGDIEKLTKVKGIGASTANRMITKYKAAKPDMKLLAKLNDMGLEFTANLIERLKATFGNTDKVIDVLENEPYQLVKVPMIGFAKADEIALKSGKVSPQSPARIGGWIQYYLQDQFDNNGNSYVYASQLNTALIDYFGREIILYQVGGGSNVADAINMLKRKNEINIIEDPTGNKARRKIYLQRTWELEHNIAIELRRIINAEPIIEIEEGWEERVDAQEEAQGFKFADEQREAIGKAINSNFFVIGGYAGCVDCDTEFFNGKKWKKISEYEEGDMVLQWNEPEVTKGSSKDKEKRKELVHKRFNELSNGKAELVYPKHYIKKECEKFYHFNKGSDQMFSEDHIVTHVSAAGYLKNTNVDGVNPTNSRYISSFNYEGKGIELTDGEIRVMVAVMADGRFPRNTNWCRIQLKKERKKERLESILAAANIDYKKKDSTVEGVNIYTFYAPRREKEYSEYWYNCNKHQLEVIKEEVMLWDGYIGYGKDRNVKRMEFSTTSKMSADFIQFVYSSCGIHTSIIIDDRIGGKYKNICYIVRPRQVYNLSCYRGAGVKMNGEHPYDIVPSPDGYKYCFEVPSGYLVLRRNNKIFITHNCGKSTLLKGVLAALGDEVNIGTCALSGRAAANLQGIGDNKTIHKLLDYRVGQGFGYKKGIPMPYDVVILDEMGMVGGPLFLSLIEAVKSGARVICLGDPAQLESIGSLCLMRDMLESEYIPSVTLTQIHRQAAESGIISTSMDVREGVCFFNQTMYEGIDICKKDLCTDLTTLRDNICNRAVAWYRKMHSVYEPLDIMVIGFTNMRGRDSVYQLNKAIQEALGTHAKHERGKYFRGAYVGSNAMQHNIFKDDVVMCVKNNYNVSSYNDEDTIMFNGWRGVVEDITDQFVYINFKEANTKVKLDYATATEYITLGYAVTAHKSQGSTIPCVITVFSYSAYTMLNRNILYTAITRASKKCVVIAESAAYQKATQTEFVSQKNTFWRDGMLEEVLC